MGEKSSTRELDIKLAAAMGMAVYFNEWDTSQEIPLYIPSGKPWKTHSLEAKLLPNFYSNYGAAFSLLDLFKEMTAFKLERGMAPWWWCGLAFASGVSVKGEGEAAPIAICNVVSAGLEVYPVVSLQTLSREQLLLACQKRRLKGWDEHTSRQALIQLLSPLESTDVI
jgi:hypothetical protein